MNQIPKMGNGRFTSIGRSLQQGAGSRLVSLGLLCILFWVVAAASFSGFIGKWGLRDGEARYGIELMIDATAQKPFVYRQLVPAIANFIDRHTSIQGLVKARPEKTFVRTTSSGDPDYRFQYACIYYASLLALFLSLFVLRRILLDCGIERVTAVLAPAAFVLAFPYLQTVGGYFYDSIELFFASLVFLAALRGKVFLLIALALPATLNKETFFFLLPALYPLLRQTYSVKKALVATGLAILVSGLANVALKLAFIDAPGGAAEFHLFVNIKRYLTVRDYFQLEDTYGLLGPAGPFLGTLVVIAAIVVRGWPHCSPSVRRHVAIAAALNLPLFLVFCAHGELRNLSLMYVGFVILIGCAIDGARARSLAVGTPLQSRQPHTT